MTDLIELKRELLLLSSQEVRDELLDLELDTFLQQIDALEKDNAYLLMPIVSFRSTIRSIGEELRGLDMGKSRAKIKTLLERLRKLELSRRSADVAATAAAEAVPKVLPNAEPMPSCVKLLQDLCGMRFAFVPAGKYPLGTKPDTVFFLSEGFWISAELLTLRHYQCMILNPTHFTVTSIPLEVLSSNRVTYVRSGDHFICAPRAECPSAIDRDVPHPLHSPLELPFWFATRLAKEMGGAVPPWQLWEAAARGPEGHSYPWGSTMNPDEVYTDPGTGEIMSFGRYTASLSRPYGLSQLASTVPEWNTAEFDQGLPQRGVHHSPWKGDPPCTHLLRRITNQTTLGSQFWPYESFRCGTFRLCFPTVREPYPVKRDERFLEKYPPGTLPLTGALVDCLGKGEMHLFQLLGRGEYESEDGHHVSWPSRGVSISMNADRVVADVHFHRGLTVASVSVVDYAPYLWPLPGKVHSFHDFGHSLREVEAIYKKHGSTIVRSDEARVEIRLEGSDNTHVVTLCGTEVIMLTVRM